jgi:hypothetical protein
MVSMSITVNEYTARVLGVVKEKFGLKDKAKALDRFADMFGEEFVEKKVNDNTMKEMVNDCNNWEKKHKFKRKMSINELDKLCNIN